MKRKFQAFNFSVVPTNASNGKKSVDVYIDGQIIDAESQDIYREWFGDTTSVSYKSFRNELMSEDAQIYNIYINSGGGLVTDAMAMHDLLQDLQRQGKTVNTEGRGIIASAATFILMAGESPRMSANSWLMIHNVSGFAYGTVDEVEGQAKVMRQFNDRVAKFYEEKTGLSNKVVNEMMNAETWMTADDAKAKGFIGEITGEATITNAIRKENWFYHNTAVLNSYNQQVVAPPVPTHNFQQQLDEMKKFWQDFKTGLTNAIKPVATTDTTAAAEGTTTAPATPDLAAAIANTFDAFESRFDEEAGTLVTNKFNDLVTALPKNESFTKLVNDAVAAQVTALNLATKEEVKKVDDVVVKLEDKTGAASTANDAGAGKKRIGRWEGSKS